MQTRLLVCSLVLIALFGSIASCGRAQRQDSGDQIGGTPVTPSPASKDTPEPALTQDHAPSASPEARPNPTASAEDPTPGSAAGNPQPTPSQEDQERDALADRLIAVGYMDLFHRDDDALHGVWKEPGAPGALAALAIDPDAPALARFLAAEILFYKDDAYPPEQHKGLLAPVYATALAQNFTGVANPWGLPDVLDGDAGVNFGALGEAALPQLIELLSNDSRVFYEGSQEATMGHHYGYRVKDLAAFYIAKIRHIPLELDEDPATRDDAIEQLKRAVE